LKVAVALSGGVDSFVSALLLKQEGYDVIGVFMKVIDDEELLEGSRLAASLLNIKHYVIDLRGPFRNLVIEPFLKAYLEGKTPNPCVICNEVMKFSLLKEEAQKLGARLFATGHYVRKSPWEGKWALFKGKDQNRDQSYFLWRISQKDLEETLFPLGDKIKEEVKELAKSYGLIRKESREVCFIKGDYRAFIEGFPFEKKEGPILDAEGKVLGWHKGVHLFTVGQRHGLGLKREKPFYVLKIEDNKVIVGPKEGLYKRRLRAKGARWILGEPPSREFFCYGKIRYRHKEAPCRVVVEGEEIFCEFLKPQMSITPGQALVLYEGERLLGGGWIEEVVD
jgi:tRNA-specific 2-thiouridylase